MPCSVGQDVTAIIQWVMQHVAANMFIILSNHLPNFAFFLGCIICPIHKMDQ